MIPIWYTTVDRYGNPQHEEVVIASRVVRLSKDENNFNITIIHLDTGETLCTSDSMKTIAARIHLTSEPMEARP